MKQYFLGIELGSTRIKAVLLDEAHQIVKSGDATWKSSLENGVWTYHMDAVQAGLCTAVRNLGELPGEISAMGVSGMMHGYLAFDKNWNLLAPFRTWQNTMTGEAAAQLTEAFGFNIPQRGSIAHLYQAILNGEYHVREIAHITTLAGYVHFLLTGENAVGIGEASGMFPIDSEALGYDAVMLDKFGALTEKYGFDWSLRDILPKVLTAGQAAGLLTASGSAYLGGLLPAGIPLCPPEGDAGTGMTATNAVAPRTGNVSAGTSIFSMVVLEKPLSKVYPEIDMVTTPSGAPVAMVHCNNCTNDMNAWVSLLGETAALFGAEVSTGELFTKLYQKSLEGEADCSGVLTYNYRPRRPVQNAARRSEIHGGSLPRAGYLYEIGRRRRPLRYGTACSIYAAEERRTKPGGVSRQGGLCGCGAHDACAGRRRRGGLRPVSGAVPRSARGRKGSGRCILRRLYHEKL